jgi:hypothetical protein
MLLQFRQWLEDAGEVHPRLNTDAYAAKGARSKMVQTNRDRMEPSEFSPAKLFGKKKMKKKMSN